MYTNYSEALANPVGAFSFLPETQTHSPAGVTDMSQMPEKNSDVWAALLAWWATHQASLHAMGLSMAIAVVRVIYGGGKGKQMALEAVLCGLATLSLIPVLEWLGLPQSMSSFIGGMVGFLGVEKLRDLAERFGRSKVGG